MERESLVWECLWIDDGSTDGSMEALRALAEADSRHRYISFERRAGQSAACWAGFHEARGAIIATLDGDGQNDPADIPSLFRIVRSGEVDVVNGYRARRRDSFTRKMSAFVANGFRNRITGKSARDVGCSTRAFRRECVLSLPGFSGMHRFLPTLFALQGYKQTEVPVNHRSRLTGRSKYAVNNRLWIGLLDTFGVRWLQKRAIRYKIRERSEQGRLQVPHGTEAKKWPSTN